MSPKFFYITLSQASILLPVIAGATYYKKLSQPFRVFFYFFITTIGFEIQASVLKQIYHNNMPGLHLFTLVECLAFSVVYYQHLQKNSIFRLFIGINSIVFIALCFVDAFLINSIWTLNPISRSYSSVSMICYTLGYFYSMFRKDTLQYSSEHPLFWVNVGALIYFGSNTLYFMLGYWFLRKVDMALFGLFFHAMINIIANCLYAQSFRCFKNQKATL